MRIHLQIKIKSLAAEARIIRQAEKRLRNANLRKPSDTLAGQRQSLYDHRTKDVRGESRSANLAYGFLRGRSYAEMESWSYTIPDWARVEKLIEKFGTGDRRDQMQTFSQWKDEAEAHRGTQTKPVSAAKPSRLQPETIEALKGSTRAKVTRATRAVLRTAEAAETDAKTA